MQVTILGTALLGALLLSGCDDDDAAIFVTTNEPGSFDADWTGVGGSATEAFVWTNNQGAAEFSMDITAASGGAVDVTVEDADGDDVATFGLEAGVGDDSLDGQTSVGTPGEWTVTIVLTDFVGDGTVSLGAANPDDL